MDQKLLIRFEHRYGRGPGGGPTISADLELDPGLGKVWVLFGPSGSGKTTLLRVLAGLERPRQGEIRLGAQAWLDTTTKTFVRPQHRNVGFLHQHYALFPHMSVDENILYGPNARGTDSLRRVQELKAMLRIEDLGERYPGQISGGQRQRVALARALAPDPKLLLLDEPLSALDTPGRAHLRAQLRAWLLELDIMTIVVTHDRAEAMTLGDQIIVQNDGQICQTGPVAHVFHHPADLTAAQVLGTENLIPAHVLESTEAATILEVGQTRLHAPPSSTRPASKVHVAFRAESVRLVGPDDDENTVHATVLSLQPEGPLTRVTLGGELSLVMFVLAGTRLQVGQAVTVVIPRDAIHVV